MEHSKSVYSYVLVKAPRLRDWLAELPVFFLHALGVSLIFFSIGYVMFSARKPAFDTALGASAFFEL